MFSTCWVSQEDRRKPLMEYLDSRYCSVKKLVAHPVGTATLGNQWPRAREHFNSRYGLAEAIMVETMVYSGEVGMHKPQAGIYQLACHQMVVRPEEALFLDDREDWVEGARQLGMHGIVFRETAQALADVRACLDAHSPKH